MTRQSDLYKRIKINVRHTYGGNGDVVADSLVCCPVGDTMVSMDRCATCGFCDGLIFDGAPDHSFIICRRLPVPRDTKRELELVQVQVPTSADKTRVADIMNRSVFCVGPDLSLAGLSELLLARGFSGAPVVDAAGRPIGVVTKTDLLRSRMDTREWREKTVAELMMPVVLSVPESATIAQASALMSSERVHRLPVVSDSGVVVGIVSSMDVLAWLAEMHEYELPARGVHQRR
jgi:CBS domain-containing protein